MLLELFLMGTICVKMFQVTFPLLKSNYFEAKSDKSLNSTLRLGSTYISTVVHSKMLTWKVADKNHLLFPSVLWISRFNALKFFRVIRNIFSWKKKNVKEFLEKIQRLFCLSHDKLSKEDLKKEVWKINHSF